jgi:hypothetical protein
MRAVFTGLMINSINRPSSINMLTKQLEEYINN